MAIMLCVLILLSGASFIVFWYSVRYIEYGKFYSLQEAYDEGIITYDDLLSIAYYQNGGTVGNEKVMGANYVPQPKTPEELAILTRYKIKATAANSIADYKRITVDVYYGTYGGAVAVMWSDSSSSFPTGKREVIIADVLFWLPYRTLKIWKEN